MSGIHVPMEIWKMILSHIPPWEVNVLMYISLAHINRTARQVFLGDAAWRYLNPYGVESEIFHNFWSHLQSLEAQDQQSLRIVWEAARKALEPGGSNELYYMVLKNKLPTLKSTNSPYYDLGFLLGTAYSYSRKDTRIRNLVRNRQVIWCAVSICPLCVDHVDHKQLGKDVALQAARTLMKMSRLFRSSVKFVDANYSESTLIIDVQLSSKMATPHGIKRPRSSIGQVPLPMKASKVRQLTEPVSGLERKSYHASTVCGYGFVCSTLDMNLKCELPLDALRAREFCLSMFESTSKNASRGFYFGHPDIKAKVVEAIGCVWSPEMRDDLGLMNKFVQWSGLALKLASPRLQANKGLVLDACLENGMAVKYVGSDVQIDKSIALAVASSNGLALELLPLRFRTDCDVVHAAVKTNGLALEFASTALRNNIALCRSAIAVSGMAIQYVPEPLAQDPILIRNALLSNSLSLEFMAPQIRDDKEYMLMAVSNNGLALKFASESLQNDPHVVFTAVSSCGGALQYASDESRACASIVRKAILGDYSAIEYASLDLSNDLGLLELAKAMNAPEKRGRSGSIIVI